MQPPKRFQAPTIEEAYERVREALGDQAIIMSTRTATAPGFMGAGPREFVEITAHLPEGVSPPPPRPAPAPGPERRLEPERPLAPELRRPAVEVPVLPPHVPPRARVAAPPMAPPADGDNLAPPFLNDLAGSARTDPGLLRRLQDRLETTLREAQPPTAEPSRAAVPTPPALDDGMSDIEDEDSPAPRSASVSPSSAAVAEQLAEMRRMLEELSLARANDRLGDGSPALREARRRLFEQGLGASVLLPLLNEVADGVAPGSDGPAVMRTLERKLAGRLPPPVRLNLARRPTAIYLVGPAGSGKTTMAIRLALEVERAFGLRVAIAGTDVHRVGGPQQLSAIGAATGIPVRLCYTPGELQALLAERTADVVVVDTPGHNGTRRDRMTELTAFTQAARHRSVLLVMPATMKGQDLVALAEAYRPLDLGGVVLTRCDETSTFGHAFSATAEAGVGVAFTVHGESVVDAPRPGDNVAFARAVVRGQWPEPVAPSRGREAVRTGAVA